MRLLVLGATGGVGRHLVGHALADGHAVTAVVRDPARLPVRHDALTVVRANALDTDSLTEVLETAHGVDAVVSGLGQAGRRDPRRPASTSAAAAVTALSAAGVARLVVVSAAPLNRTGEGQSWFSHRVAGPALWTVLGELYRDLDRMERLLADSDLAWTAVRPPRLTDKPGTGRYRHTVGGGPTGVTIPRADVARAMLDIVAMPETERTAVGVSS